MNIYGTFEAKRYSLIMLSVIVSIMQIASFFCAPSGMTLGSLLSMTTVSGFRVSAGHAANLKF